MSEKLDYNNLEVPKLSPGSMWEIKMIELTWNLTRDCLPAESGSYCVTIEIDEEYLAWYVDVKYYSSIERQWLEIDQNYVKAWRKMPCVYQPSNI
jgi:uncharacterized membrane protein